MKMATPLFQKELNQLDSPRTEVATFTPINVQKMRESNITTTNYSPRVVQTLQTIHDPLAVLSFGQNEIAKISEKSDLMLQQMDDTKVDFIVEQLSSIMKMVEHDKSKDKSFATKLKSLFIDVKEDTLANINSTETQMNRVINEIDDNVESLKEKINQLSITYKNNMDDYLLLTELVNDAKIVLQIKQEEYERLSSRSDMTPMQIEETNALKQQIDRFDKRLMTLEKMQFVTMQTAPSIRHIQDSGVTLLEKFEVIKSITIPMWKRTAKMYSDALGIGKAATLANSIDNANNDLMLASARKHQELAVLSARVGQRDVVDTSTLMEVNKTLIDTFKEVVTINRSGEEERSKTRELLAQAKADYLTTIRNKYGIL